MASSSYLLLVAGIYPNWHVLSNCHIKHATAAWRTQLSWRCVRRVSFLHVLQHIMRHCFLLTFVVLESRTKCHVLSSLLIICWKWLIPFGSAGEINLWHIALYFPSAQKNWEHLCISFYFAAPNRGKQLPWLLRLQSNYQKYLVRLSSGCSTL